MEDAGWVTWSSDADSVTASAIGSRPITLRVTELRLRRRDSKSRGPERRKSNPCTVTAMREGASAILKPVFCSVAPRTRDRASALIGRLHGRVCCGILWGNRAGGAFVDLVDEGLGHQFRNVRRDYRIRIEIARTYTRNAWLEHGPGWVVVLGSVVESSGVVVLQTSQALAPAASCMLTISPSSRRSP